MISYAALGAAPRIATSGFITRPRARALRANLLNQRSYIDPIRCASVRL
jgi:hypothetical protein